MTGGQRKTHVLMWLALAPLALIGLVLAVVWRPAEPVQDGPLPGVAVDASAAGADAGSTP